MRSSAPVQPGCVSTRPTRIVAKPCVRPVQATPQPASRRPVNRAEHGNTIVPLLSIAHLRPAQLTHSAHRLRSTAQSSHHQTADAQTDHNSTSTFTSHVAWRLLPMLSRVAVLLCLPLLAGAILQTFQQSSLLALAGVLLPLQSRSAQRHLARFNQRLQAAAAEAETAEANADKTDEQANDNGVIESGAELGNVQTPASVWLPYNTSGATSKVSTLLMLQCRTFRNDQHSSRATPDHCRMPWLCCSCLLEQCLGFMRRPSVRHYY